MSRTPRTSRSSRALPLVQIRWIDPFLEVLEEHKVPYDGMLDRTHLPVVGSVDRTTLVPTARVWEFVALAHRESGIDDLGFRAGKLLHVENFLPDRERAWSRPGTYRSVDTYMEALVETSSRAEMWIRTRADALRTSELGMHGTFGTEHEAFPVTEQLHVAIMTKVVRTAAGPVWNPTSVNLRSSRTPESGLRDFVGDAVVKTSQSVTSIVFPSQPFVGPIPPFPQRGSTIWKRHRRALTRNETIPTLSGSLRLVLRSYLPDGSPTLRRAAELTGMSVRTLQRRLKSEGVFYSELIEDLRHDLALYLLRNPELEASQISADLGYRDAAIFTRAFRRWTGQTPTQYRQSLRQ